MFVSAEPDHERANNNLRYYNQQLEERNRERGARGDTGDSPEPFKNERLLDEYRKSDEFSRYEALCRGEDVVVSWNLKLVYTALCCIQLRQETTYMYMYM